MIEEWMKDGAPVLYSAVYPDGETYEGEIDGKPWAIGTKKDRWVVRLKNMDAKYIKRFGRYVVSFTDLKFISRRKTDD